MSCPEQSTAQAEQPMLKGSSLAGLQFSQKIPIAIQTSFLLMGPPVGMLERLQLLLPLLLSLGLGLPPGLRSSSPVLLPLSLPFSQLGCPLGLPFSQLGLPLLVCLPCPLLLGLYSLTHLALPMPTGTACSGLMQCCTGTNCTAS